MAKKGRRPIPTALKLLRGNPGKRPINANEPQPEQGIPSCPDWLDDEARECWMRMTSLLQSMGVMTLIDADALTTYCSTWSLWKRAVLFLQKNGDIFTIKDESGKVKCIIQWPQVSIARNLVTVLNRIQQEFGMTPSSRTSIHAATAPANEATLKFQAYLARKKKPRAAG